MALLHSFDIADRKGLEIVILTALLTFQDTNEAYHTRDAPYSDSESKLLPTTPPLNIVAPRPSIFGLRRTSETRLDPPPAEVPALPMLPPRPERRTGVERIAEMHALRAAQGEGEANEVEVAEEGRVEDYALYAEKLLQVRCL